MDLPFCLSLKLDLLRLQASLISDDPRAAKGPSSQPVSIRRPPPPELASRVDSALTHLDMAVAAFYAEDGGRDEKGDDDEIVRWEKICPKYAYFPFESLIVGLLLPYNNDTLQFLIYFITKKSLCACESW